MKRFFPKAGPYNLEQKIMMFMWFKNQKAQGNSIFWSLVKLVAENNSVEIFEEAQNLVANEDGLLYGVEEDEDDEDSESEYETTDSETDDEDQDRLGFSCPFCQELFNTQDLAENHILVHDDD